MCNDQLFASSSYAEMPVCGEALFGSAKPCRAELVACIDFNGAGKIMGMGPASQPGRLEHLALALILVSELFQATRAVGICSPKSVLTTFCTLPVARAVTCCCSGAVVNLC